ncbi:hypothetical protein V8F20_005511 [Naviculisporaceae sp. PSN 640]
MNLLTKTAVLTYTSIVLHTLISPEILRSIISRGHYAHHLVAHFLVAALASLFSWITKLLLHCLHSSHFTNTILQRLV